MPKYIDCLAIPVPKRKLALYCRFSRRLGKIWRDHGALQYFDCVADDVKVGKWTSYPQAVKLKRDETVVIEYIVYKSRRDRDRIMKEVLKDPRFAPFMDRKAMPIPFDGKRVVKGGFKFAVEF